MQRALRVARGAMTQVFSPPPHFPDTSRPRFPHRGSLLVTSHQLHLCTTQQNGRLATGKAESACSGSSQARPRAKPQGVSDGAPKPKHHSPLKVPNPRSHRATCSRSRGHFYRQRGTGASINRCQVRRPGWHRQGQAALGIEETSEGAGKGPVDGKGAGDARRGRQHGGQGCRCQSSLPGRDSRRGCPTYNLQADEGARVGSQDVGADG